MASAESSRRDHAKKDRLQDIFGVGGVAGDPVGRPEHHGMVLAVHVVQRVRDNRNRILVFGCGYQHPTR